MKSGHLQWLACPHCGSNVTVEHGKGRDLQEAILRCEERHRAVVKRGVARFVSEKEAEMPAEGRLADELDSTHGGRYWHDRFATITGFPIELLAGKRVLEVGCGTGRYTEWIARYAEHVVAVEPTARVEIARQSVGMLANVTVVQGALDKPPVQGGYDVVLMLDGLLGTTAPARALRSAERLTKRGGTIYLAMPRRRSFLPRGIGVMRKAMKVLPIEASFLAGRVYAEGRLALSEAGLTKRWAGFREEHAPTADQLIGQFVSTVQSAGPVSISKRQLARWIGRLRVEGRSREAVALRKRVVEIAPVRRHPRAARGHERQVVGAQH